MKGLVVGIFLGVGLIVVKASIFIVTEGQQAIITEFGRPIGEPITTAGVKFKKPFVQEIRFVDKRILSWDGFPNQIPTKDKKFIKVDTTARWRIVDSLKFIQTVRNEKGAKARIDTILDSATRNVISSHNLVEAVRNSDGILEQIERNREDLEKRVKKGDNIVEEEVTGEIERILVGREALSQLIAKRADKELEAFGINLIDVQLRRISYEKSVEAKVYERMISERQRIAQKIRSIGQGEKAKIEGRLQRDLRTIESQAYRKAQKVRGIAEAKATKIYAESMGAGSEFYSFIKSMEVYDRALKNKLKLILSADSEFLKYLRSLE